MKQKGWPWLGVLGACTMGLACQRTVAITPPPTVEAGSLWVVAKGDRQAGSTFVRALAPGEPVQLGPVAFDEALEVYAFHQRCTLPEIFGAADQPVPTGDLELRREPRAGAVLPAALRSYRSLVAPDNQSAWREEATVPEEALSTLNRAPLPNDHGCQMGVSDVAYEGRFIKGFGKPGTILHPKVSIAVGTDRALLALSYALDLADATRVGHGVFEFPIDAVDGSQLIPIRESDTASQAYFGGVVLGQEAWLHKSGHLDRLDLSSDPWRFDDTARDTFTASVNMSRIEYQSLMAGSNRGEEPEILMLTTRVEFAGMAQAESRPTALRRFDPVSRSWTVYFDEAVRVRGPTELLSPKEISLQRLGPGEAVAIGLDGDNTHLFHLRGGQVSTLTPPMTVTRYGDLVRIYRPPAVGTVVATRQGALFLLELEGPTWTLIRAPYEEGSEAAARGDIANILGSSITPEGFLLIGPRPGGGGEAILYRPELRFCGGQDVGLYGFTRGFQLPDRHVALGIHSGTNTLEVHSSRLRRRPLECAVPSGM